MEETKRRMELEYAEFFARVVSCSNTFSGTFPETLKSVYNYIYKVSGTIFYLWILGPGKSFSLQNILNVGELVSNYIIFITNSQINIKDISDIYKNIPGKFIYIDKKLPQIKASCM